MTMRVTVTNTDPVRKLRVTQRSKDLDSGSVHPEKPTEVLPGASTDVWLHNGRDCLLEEV